MAVTSECPEILAGFVKGRRGWRARPEKLGCWSAYRNVQIFGRDLHLLVTPNWRDKESAQDWIAEVIDTSNGNARIASYRGTYDEVTAEIIRTERTLDLVEDLRACRSREAAEALVENVRGRQLDLLRQVLELPRGTAERTRARIVHRTCGSRLDMDAIRRR